jgi:putative nucleotidyltransferase with HDIG domain
VTELELADSNLISMLSEAGPQVMVAAAHAADHRNPLAQGHSSRVAWIADAVGRRSGLLPNQLEDLQTAAFLHDVGHMTLAADGANLEAPGHAAEGARIVEGARFPLDVVAAVRNHHDRWDGVDQAGGMTGEQIPVMARILAVTEKFEALTAGRGCLRVTSKEALDQIVARSGLEFDPAVIEALGRAVRENIFEVSLPTVALPATPVAPAAATA